MNSRVRPLQPHAHRASLNPWLTDYLLWQWFVDPPPSSTNSRELPMDAWQFRANPQTSQASGGQSSLSLYILLRSCSSIRITVSRSDQASKLYSFITNCQGSPTPSSELVLQTPSIYLDCPEEQVVLHCGHYSHVFISDLSDISLSFTSSRLGCL